MRHLQFIKHFVWHRLLYWRIHNCQTFKDYYSVPDFSQLVEYNLVRRDKHLAFTVGNLVEELGS